MARSRQKARPSTQDIAEQKVLDDDEWTPAPTLDQLDGLDLENWAYRWVAKAPQRVKKFLTEGWTFVNQAEGDRVLHKRSTVGGLDAGSAMTSEVDYREVVMMKLPRKRAEARRRYYQRLTDKSANMINRDAADTARDLGGEMKATIRVQSGDQSQVTVIE